MNQNAPIPQHNSEPNQSITMLLSVEAKRREKNGENNMSKWIEYMFNIRVVVRRTFMRFFIFMKCALRVNERLRDS